MTMKRSVGETEFDNISSMATCLMLLSRGHEYVASSDNTNFSSRVFECKTCNKQFLSFQALGGHRASHKKPKTSAMTRDGGNDSSMGQSLPSKPKTHECSVCGLEFSIGQALGGHMRRHRATTMGGSQNSGDNNNSERRVDQASVQVPVVKKSSSRRVLLLDLNLTPTENDLKLETVKTTPPIFCYI